MRVQIPAYMDMWMMGDRYGEVTKVTKRPRYSAGVRASLLTGERYSDRVDIATVRLDISGRTVRVILDDCVEVG